MKLRMKENSIRLRIARSELARLIDGETVRESVRLAPGTNGLLSYGLQAGEQQEPVTVSFEAQQILVSLSLEQLSTWRAEDQIGVYATLPVEGDVTLEVALEKDFACLDGGDVDNSDTFANPLAGAVC